VAHSPAALRIGLAGQNPIFLRRPQPAIGIKREMDALFSVELSPFQRMLIIWVFIAVGLVIAVQVSQAYEQRPPAWTRLTKDSR
jgi:hypothetical protein